MTTDRELLEMALEALEPDVSRAKWAVEEDVRFVIKALRTRLAEPDLAKVGEVGVWGQREWRGLTDEEIVSCAEGIIVGGLEFARAIEDKLKERNT
jgi:hypothetical protein